MVAEVAAAAAVALVVAAVITTIAMVAKTLVKIVAMNVLLFSVEQTCSIIVALLPSY